jgi:hypothetical protein
MALDLTHGTLLGGASGGVVGRGVMVGLCP